MNHMPLCRVRSWNNCMRCPFMFFFSEVFNNDNDTGPHFRCFKVWWVQMAPTRWTGPRIPRRSQWQSKVVPVGGSGSVYPVLAVWGRQTSWWLGWMTAEQDTYWWVIARVHHRVFNYYCSQISDISTPYIFHYYMHSRVTNGIFFRTSRL